MRVQILLLLLARWRWGVHGPGGRWREVVFAGSPRFGCRVGLVRQRRNRHLPCKRALIQAAIVLASWGGRNESERAVDMLLCGRCRFFQHRLPPRPCCPVSLVSVWIMMVRSTSLNRVLPGIVAVVARIRATKVLRDPPWMHGMGVCNRSRSQTDIPDGFLCVVRFCVQGEDDNAFMTLPTILEARNFASRSDVFVRLGYPTQQ